jgi:hypothetical protein
MMIAITMMATNGHTGGKYCNFRRWLRSALAGLGRFFMARLLYPRGS